MLRRNTKPHQLIKHAKISYSIVSLVFLQILVLNLLKLSKPGASKLRYSEYLKKYKKCKFHTFCWESTFWYTLAQHVVPQKFIYVSKITGHHFPVWVLNSKLRTHIHNSINSRSLLFAKYMIFWKQKFDVEQLENVHVKC